MVRQMLIAIDMLLLFGIAAGVRAESTIPASVAANGGARMSSADYSLQSTVGQAAIGFVTSTSVQHGAGFWYREGSILTPVHEAPPPFVIDPFLGPNSPNPFNPRTTVAFATATAGRVGIRLYDLVGREVYVLLDEELPAGQHEVVLDAAGLPSGIYVCRMTAGAFAQTRKLTLVR